MDPEDEADEIEITEEDEQQIDKEKGRPEKNLNRIEYYEIAQGV